jgi:hypothetical protein
MSLEFQGDDISLLYIIDSDWTGLKDVFQQRWSNLQELRVYLYGLGLPERSAARAFIRAQFPVLESRGILCVLPFDAETRNSNTVTECNIM